MPGNIPWSKRELQILTKNYNKIPIGDLKSKLKRRTIDAIRNKAKDEGLTVPQIINLLEGKAKATQPEGI